MKDPKALFPFLFASSWLGNLVLTVLAFYLAFTHEGPLSPLIFLTVALCILSGNALPISVYMIIVRFREAELKAETTEVSVRVGDALVRSEEVMARLDEAEGALAKGVLIARQVPERIRESTAQLQELATVLNKLELSRFTDAIGSQSNSSESDTAVFEELSGQIKELDSAVKGIRKDLKALPDKLSDALGELQPAQAAPDGGDPDVSYGERLDLLFESLESVQDSLDGLLQGVAGLQIQKEGGDTAGEGEGDTAVDADVDTDADVDAGEAVDADTDTAGELEELGLEEENAFELTDGRTRLIAHAMIGMTNKLFVRGDPPWLSWEDGQQMELIGIGEFAWAIDDLKEPIEVTVLLNDELAAEKGTVVLAPGKTVRIHPVFPKA